MVKDKKSQIIKSYNYKKISKKGNSSKRSLKNNKIGKIDIIKINEDSDINKYLPSLPNDMIVPKTWELQNRKTFYEWLHKNFAKYELGDKNKLLKLKNEGIHPNKDRPIPNFQLLPIQKIVRDFMQSESPYRGILLYFGLGVGKTISALAISEAITNKKAYMYLVKLH